MTKQRLIILETIRESDKHMTAEEIFLRAREKFSSLVMATVYNNLKVLVQEGKIRRIQVPGEPDRYDRNMIYHEHLICEKCGHMVDAGSDDLRSELESRLGICITRYNLSMYYICDQCQVSEEFSGET